MNAEESLLCMPPPMQWTLFNERRFVLQTDPLQGLAADVMRRSIFEYDGQSSYTKVPDRGKQLWQMSEQDGLQNLTSYLGYLASFLHDPASMSRDKNGKLEQASIASASIKDNLTFIGADEFAIGIEGIARVWVDYLKTDPKRTIYIAPNPSTETRMQRVLPKSDGFVVFQILKKVASYDPLLAARIVKDVTGLHTKPEETLLAIVDDWMVTGTQMTGRCDVIFSDRRLQPYIDAAEIHLLAAPEKLLTDGFHGSSFIPEPIVVKAVYKAHPGIGSKYGGESHITGLHSSVGFGFATELEAGLVALRKVLKVRLPRPPLATVYRPYWPKGALMRAQ